MSKILFKYSFIIISCFIIVQIYLTMSLSESIQRDKEDLLKIKDIQKALLDLKSNGNNYMAIAGTIDDSLTFAYGYTSKHRTQKSANKKAMFYCEKERKKIGISKKCRLFNSLIKIQSNSVKY